jgi:hypothetical protein
MEIRNEQIVTLSADMVCRFENEMVHHLATRFPDQVGPLGDEQFRLAIRDGIANAARFGIDCWFDVERYLELTFEVFFDLDSNPATEWAREILDSDMLAPADKLDDLEAHAILFGWIRE